MKLIKKLNMKNLTTIILLALTLSFIACGDDKYPDLEDGLYAEFITNYGTMVAKLEYQKVPVTVANFVALAEGTHPMAGEQYKAKKYYNGITFHRIMDNFMIQGGDPTATGTGDPGFKFADEFHPDLKHKERGVLSMANSGPNSNGSQFFITDAPTPWLDNVHSVFGELVLGLDVLDSLSAIEVGPGDKPVKDVIINELNIIRKGSDAKKFDAPKVFSEELPKVEQKQKELQDEHNKKMEEERSAMMEKNKEAAKDKKPILDGYKEKGQKLPSGLIVYYLEKGKGPKPSTGDDVVLNFEGYFADATLFDTSLAGIAEQHGILSPVKEQRGLYQPMKMAIGPDVATFPGLKEAVSLLKVGDKAYFYIPSYLAYGERGAGPNGEIPPNADLVFLLEMKEIVK
ncbi:peptidylprolyl isomerase [Flavobacteriaceae bacterium MAR_2010_188]|nr:peptidylprolyl isomerase [Flavobacteriaceae bacterium MAR_2010_188]